jgi:hypothetical protein
MAETEAWSPHHHQPRKPIRPSLTGSGRSSGGGSEFWCVFRDLAGGVSWGHEGSLAEEVRAGAAEPGGELLAAAAGKDDGEGADAAAQGLQLDRIAVGTFAGPAASSAGAPGYPAQQDISPGSASTRPRGSASSPGREPLTSGNTWPRYTSSRCLGRRRRPGRCELGCTGRPRGERVLRPCGTRAPDRRPHTAPRGPVTTTGSNPAPLPSSEAGSGQGTGFVHDPGPARSHPGDHAMVSTG